MLDISFGLLILTVLVLFILIYLLNKMLYKPLLGFMDKRDAMIRSDKESLESSDSEVKEALAEAEAKISDAKAQALKIREEITAKTKKKTQKEIETFKSKLESEYEEFAKGLAKEKKSLHKDLSANLATYKDAIASKLKSI